MAAPLGNRFWEARSRHGDTPTYATAEMLWEACYDYFVWVEANPLMEAQAFAYQGVVTVQEMPKMRAMTIGGLCIFIGLSRQAWGEYRQREGFGDVTSRVDEIIKTQKFEGASAGLLVPNIIARDLGLAEKTEDVGLSELARRLERAAARNGDA